MLLYEDYFSCDSSQSSLLDYSKFDARIYDIIFLSPSPTPQSKTEQYLSTVQWIDAMLVSRLGISSKTLITLFR
jgi:hypothetical protein